MAKDVSSRTANGSNNNDNIPPASNINAEHSQKVPPLRIVLNTSGNQKSSSTAIASSANQQQELKRDKVQENVLKSGGRVRIKLGTNKHNNNNKTISTNDQTSTTNDLPKSKSNEQLKQENNLFKEELNANYSHLRRITRRSQRSIQAIVNEDEESISSMTSIDENQNTTNNSDNVNSTSDATQSNFITIPAIQTNGSTNNGNNNGISTITNNTSNSSSTEPTRRYKRRKGETSECSFTDHLDGPFCYQNYKLPNQNSFELFKNIRKHVDKKLHNLSSIHFKTSHGFKEYMMGKGDYLLEGNKLGNGVNLYMNADGGLQTPLMNKYHRHNKSIYIVPNGSKAPPSLPVDSPLYKLFIDQEKERSRMRMQHIKEREKLTLAAEQEIIRVYNQAALVAVNQLEPFSACTMLKHQEVYNYMDADGLTILSNEDAQQDQGKKSCETNNVALATIHHESGSQPDQTKCDESSPPNEPQKLSLEDAEANGSKTLGSKSQVLNSETDNLNGNSRGGDVVDGDKKNVRNGLIEESDMSQFKTIPEDGNQQNDPEGCKRLREEVDNETETMLEKKQKTDDGNPDGMIVVKDGKDNEDTNQSFAGPKREHVEPAAIASEIKVESTNDSDDDDLAIDERSPGNLEIEEGSLDDSKSGGAKSDVEEKEGEENEPDAKKIKTETLAETSDALTSVSATKPESLSDLERADDRKIEQNAHTDNNDNDDSQFQSKSTEGGEAGDTVMVDKNAKPVLSDDDRKAYNKEIFLSKLQEVDDKWEKVRSEMLIRHKNEAESLYAVQKLEWEWKTKEIGACDIRTTPNIDNTLVPKLNIYTQDY